MEIHESGFNQGETNCMKKFFFLLAVLFLVAASAFGSSADDYVTNGIALAHKGDLDGALTDLTKAIELEPNDGYDYMIRGLFKKDKDDLDGAMADYNKAIELEPDFFGAYN